MTGTGDIVSYQYPVELPLSALFAVGSVVAKIATGRNHSLILLESGDVYGCGANSVGQLGLGDSKTAIKDALRFVKIPSLVGIRDISCGHEHSIACDRNGRLYTFGHPQYGQLGHGTDGSFIKDGGKGAAMQFKSVFLPRQVEKFVTKDTHGKLVSETPAANVNIRLVAAGKNHSVCVEEWEDGGHNKVYSFGFGGYGRLGHNSGTDELYPREIVNPFQCVVQGQQVPPTNFPQKQIVQVVAGSSFTQVISKSKHFYFWGKLSNSQRGEATMYPKIEMNLQGWNARLSAGGSNCVFVAADDAIMAWGVPVAVSLLYFSAVACLSAAHLVYYRIRRCQPRTSTVGEHYALGSSACYLYPCFILHFFLFVDNIRGNSGLRVGPDHQLVLNSLTLSLDLLQLTLRVDTDMFASL